MRFVTPCIVGLSTVISADASRATREGDGVFNGDYQVVETTAVPFTTAVPVPEGILQRLVRRGKSAAISTGDFVRKHKFAVGAVAVAGAAAMAAPTLSEINAEIAAFAAMDVFMAAYKAMVQGRARLCFDIDPSCDMMGRPGMKRSFCNRVYREDCGETTPEFALLEHAAAEALSAARAAIEAAGSLNELVIAAYMASTDCPGGGAYVALIRRLR